MSSINCIFCKIVSGQIPCYKVFENESVLAFLDIGPVSEGHTLILTKQHYERVDLCPPEVLAELGRAIHPVANAVMKAMDAPAFNVLCNNGTQAGQLVQHVHFHIIPRRDGDNMFKQWPVFKYTDGKAEIIAQKIIEKLKK